MQDSISPSGLHTGDSVQSGLKGDMLDICRRLKLSMQLVNAGAVGPFVTFGSRWTPAGHPWARLDDRALQVALAEVLHACAERVIELEGVTVAFSPIAAADGAAVGAVLLAGRCDSHDAGLLTTIGSWFAAAFGADTSSGTPGDLAAVDVRQLASLLQILDRAVGRNSEREIVGAFIEALSIWTDAESWGYLGELTEEFARWVLLPRSQTSSSPSLFPADMLPRGPALRLLSVAEARQAGFDGETAIMVSRIRPIAASEWVIAARCAPEGFEQTRFVLYSHVLACALHTLAAYESSRLTWAMLQHLRLTIHDGSLTRQAEAAVEDLGRLIGGPAAFTVAKHGARPLLAVRSAEVPGCSVASRKRSDWLRVPVSAAPYDAALEIGRPAARPITKRDEALAQHAGDVLGVWLTSVLGRLVLAQGGCAGAPPPFDDVIERHTQTALEQLQDVSMIVVSPLWGEGGDDPVAEGWMIAELQRNLRPGDVAGRLSSGAVGILLTDTPRDGARAVVSRLQRLIESDNAPHLSSLAAVGLASRAAGSDWPESLVSEAAARTTAALPIPMPVLAKDMP